MSAAIDQKAYLQKYLTGRSNDKKKKKKKAIKGKGFKIIDDDIDLSKMRPLDGDELDIFNEGEDAPQIAGIIDERSEEIKKLESTKWRVINQDDGFNSNLQVEEITRDIKEVEKENELVFGKMYSDSEDEKNDSDPPVPRKSEKNRSNSKKNKKHSSDSDFSPPRRKDKSEEKKYDSDASPPRKRTKEKTSNKNYDSDLSPPRHNNDKPKRVRKSRWGDFDQEKSKQSKSLDNSPNRSRKDKTNSNTYRNKNKDYDSDLSPPRKSRRTSPKTNSQDSDVSPPRRRKSPARSEKYRNNYNHRKDQSPRNRRNDKSNRYDSDSDLSPPRKDRGRDYRNNDPPPSHKKMDKTLDGKKAGLQDALQLKQENQKFRSREDEVFKNMTDEMSGRNAKAVSRKSKRETSEDRQKLKEKAERQKELDEKYKKWSKGVKQVEAQQAAVQDFIHEASKPLARYKDDRDLEGQLKDVERAGDPMLQYMREKKRERGELGPEKPMYKGNFPPNRLNIRPGYRWDGVDRSNGYEKKYFEQQSKRKAQEEEIYKWSTEDL